MKNVKLIAILVAAAGGLVLLWTKFAPSEIEKRLIGE